MLNKNKEAKKLNNVLDQVLTAKENPSQKAKLISLAKDFDHLAEISNADTDAYALSAGNVGFILGLLRIKYDVNTVSVVTDYLPVYDNLDVYLTKAEQAKLSKLADQIENP